MVEYHVREARPDDVDGILTVAERGWKAAYGDFLSGETIDAAMSEWYDRERTREHVESDDVAYLVAEDGGEVVGYDSGGPSEEDGVATLGAIYVDPDHWNEGIGTALLEGFESFCLRHGFEEIEFQVLSENDLGASFYAASGYEEVDERETDLFGETVTERVFRGPIE